MSYRAPGYEDVHLCKIVESMEKSGEPMPEIENGHLPLPYLINATLVKMSY